MLYAIYVGAGGARIMRDESVRDSDLQKLVDGLYREGINLEEAGMLYGEIAGMRFPREVAESIGSETADVPPDVAEALAYLAAQYHYAHISELVIAGRIIEHSQDIPSKRLGVVLCLSHVAYADVWGRYLAKYGKETVRNPVLEEHFQVLFDEQRMRSILIGLCVIGAISGRIVIEETQDTVDPAYNRIASFVSEAKHEDERLITMFFDRQIEDIDDHTMHILTQQADTYRDHAINIVMEGEDPYSVLGIDKRDIAERIGEQVNMFYKRIGIE